MTSQTTNTTRYEHLLGQFRSLSDSQPLGTDWMTTLLWSGGRIGANDQDDEPVFHSRIAGLSTEDGNYGTSDVLYESGCQAVIIRERIYSFSGHVRLLREQSEVITLSPELNDDDAAKLEDILKDIQNTMAQVEETRKRNYLKMSPAIRVNERKKGRNF